MTAPLRVVKPAVSYNLPEAALAVGVGETKIRDAIKAGRLTSHYIDSRQVVTAGDLAEWVETQPTERASVV